MGELTLTGLDEALLEQLSRRAAEHGRSVAEEAAAILTAEVTGPADHPQIDREEWSRRAAELRRSTGRLAVSTLDLLHEGRDDRMAGLCRSS